MFSSKALVATAAAFTVLAGSFGAAAPAQAKSKIHIHFGHGHGHHWHGHHGPHFGDGCGFERRMWYRTGSYYWKRQLMLCKGWW